MYWRVIVDSIVGSGHGYAHLDIMDDSTEDVAPRVCVRHIQVLMMTVCATMLYMVRSSMAAAILTMTDTSNNNTQIEIYNWSAEVQGIVLSSFYWGYTVMQIPAGILGKKYGGKMLLFVALLLNGGLNLITPMLAKYGGWMAVCAVRVVQGLSQASFMPTFHTLLGKWAPPGERTTLSTYSYAGIQIGTIIAMPICGLLASTTLGWKLIYYTMGAATLVTSLLWAAFTASSPAEHRLITQQELLYIETSLQSTGKENDIPIPWRKILTSVPLMAIMFTHVASNWTFVFFLVEIPTYMKIGLNMDTTSYVVSALPFVAQWVSMTVCSVVCQYITNNNILSLTHTRKLFNTIGAVGIAVGFLVMSFLYSEQSTLAVGVLCFTVAIFGCCCCGFMLNHIDLSPNFGGVMFSITNCVANLVGCLLPVLTGFVLGDNPSDISRWRIIFFTSAALVIAADIVYVLFSTSELQEWNNPQQKYHAGELQNEEESEERKYKFPEKNVNL